MRNVWSQEKVSIFLDNWTNKSVSLQELTLKLGVDELGTPFTPRSLRSRAKTMKLPARGAAHRGVWTEEKKQILTEHWAQGYSAGQIGQILGMTRNAVIGKKHRLGLPKRHKSPTTSKTSLTRRPRRTVRTVARKRPSKLSKPPTFVKIQPLDPRNQGVLIDQLQWVNGLPSTCRAILRDSPDGALYCNLPVAPGQSYCHGHCAQFLNNYHVPGLVAAE